MRRNIATTTICQRSYILIEVIVSNIHIQAAVMWTQVSWSQYLVRALSADEHFYQLYMGSNIKTHFADSFQANLVQICL